MFKKTQNSLTAMTEAFGDSFLVACQLAEQAVELQGPSQSYWPHVTTKPWKPGYVQTDLGCEQVLGLEDLVPRTECKNLIITSVCDYVKMR
jgi:hypothetical protein